ncbi:hypothetical protein HK096_007252, partial [Nowakowskiella sp. JEL0078]
ELLRKGSYRELINRFENQPQLMNSGHYSSSTRNIEVLRIQKDPECLRLYALALAQEGHVDILVDRIISIVNSGNDLLDHQHTSQPSYFEPSTQTNLSSSINSTMKSNKWTIKPPLSEGRPRTVKSKSSDLENLISKSRESNISNDSGIKSKNSGFEEPVHVIISEGWSW